MKYNIIFETNQQAKVCYLTHIHDFEMLYMSVQLSDQPLVDYVLDCHKSFYRFLLQQHEPIVELIQTPMIGTGFSFLNSLLRVIKHFLSKLPI